MKRADPKSRPEGPKANLRPGPDTEVLERFYKALWRIRLFEERATDLFKKGIVDAAKVTRSALQNAASIAAMVLTTETLVTDLPEKEKAGAGAGHDHGGGMDF